MIVSIVALSFLATTFAFLTSPKHVKTSKLSPWLNCDPTDSSSMTPSTSKVVSESELEKLLSIINDYRRKGWRPPYSLVTPTLHLARKFRRLSICSDLFEFMLGAYPLINCYAYESVIGANYDCGEYHESIAILKQMLLKRDSVGDSLRGSKRVNFNRCVQIGLRSCTHLAKAKDSRGLIGAVDITEQLLEIGLEISPALKSQIVNCFSIDDDPKYLASIAPRLFQKPVPDNPVLERVMWLLWEKCPQVALDAFVAHLDTLETIQRPSNSSMKAPYPPTAKCFTFAVKALVSRQQSPSATRDPFRGGDGKRSDMLTVSDVVHKEVQYGVLNVPLVLNALSACRELLDWQSALEVFTVAKEAAKRGQLPLQKIGGIESEPEPEMASPPSRAPSSTAAPRSSNQHNPPQHGIASSLPPPVVYGQTAAALAKSGAEAQTFQVMCELLEAGVRPTPLTVDFVCLELSKRGAVQAMVGILDQLKRHGVQPSSLALRALLNACERVGAYAEAVAMYGPRGRIRASDLDNIAVSVLLKSCDKLGLPTVAAGIVEDFWKQGVQVEFYVYYMLFAIFTKSNKPTLAIKFLLAIEKRRESSIRGVDGQTETDRHGDPDVVALIRALAGRYETGIIDEQLSDLLELKHPVLLASQCLYAAVIFCLSNEGRGFEGLLLLERFVARGGLESEEMYSSIISSFKGTRDVAAADAVFRLLKKRIERVNKSGGVDQDDRRTQLQRLIGVPTEVSTNDAYMGTFDSKDTEVAASDAPSAGQPKLFKLLQLSSSSFNALLSVHSASKVTPSESTALLEEMEGRGLAWDEYTYTALMAGAGAGAGDAATVLDLWRRLVSQSQSQSQLQLGPRSAPMAAAVLEALRACVRQGDGRLAVEVMEWVWSATPSSDSRQAWNTNAVQPAISRRHPSPTNLIPSVTTTIPMQLTSNSATAAGQGAAAANMSGGEIGEMVAMPVTGNVIPEMKICSLTLMALLREEDGDGALAFVERMRERGLRPDRAHYSIVMNALVKSQQWRKAVNLILQMRTRGQPLDSKIVNAAIGVTAQAQQWPLVLQLYEQLPRLARFAPTVSTHSHAILAAVNLNNTTKVLEILKSMEAKDVTTPFLSKVISHLDRVGMQAAMTQVFNEYVQWFVGPDEMTTKPYCFISKHSMVVDLHGYSIPVAKAAVLSSLAELRDNLMNEFKSAQPAPSFNGMNGPRSLVLITGLGKHSREQMEPVLKPVMQQWLEEAFDPPLCAAELVDNLGRLIVPGKRIQEWVFSGQANLLIQR